MCMDQIWLDYLKKVTKSDHLILVLLQGNPNMYRASSHLLVDWVCNLVDLNFECSNARSILPGLMGIWQKRLGNMGRVVEHPNQSQHNQGPRADETPCRCPIHISNSIEFLPDRSLEQNSRQPGSLVTREAPSLAPPSPRPTRPSRPPRPPCRAAPAHRGRPPPAAPGRPPARRRPLTPLRARPASAGAAAFGRPDEPVRAAEAALPVAVRAVSVR